MEWKEDVLGNVLEVKYGKDHKKLADGQYPVYGSGGLMRYVDSKLYDGPSILIPRKGTLNNIMFVDNPFWTVDTMFWSIINTDKVDPKFLFYSICKRDFASMNVGSAVPSMTVNILNDIQISYPKNIDDQRRIASILSSLDRKIELNNKINADLEEMAQAFFKNWFVDFEPFKDGKFVDSELGMIPEGWKVGTLGELCNFKRGKNLLTKNAIDEGVPVVAGGLEPSCYHNIANTGAPVITVSGSGANAGFMRMYHVPVWASDCSFIDISCENFYFVYCFLKVNSKLLKHAQTGAVQPHVKPSDIHDFELVIPDKESIYDFQDKVKPFFDRIASLQKENSRLSLLRDTLLPRLMSGELEVPE